MPPDQTLQNTGFTSGDYMVYLRDFAMSRGVAAKTLLANTNADLSLLLNPPNTIDESIFHRMMFNFFNTLENPYESVIEFGKGMQLSLHGSLGVAIQGAKNLNEVAELTESYYQIRANMHSIHFSQDKDFCTLRLQDAYRELDCFYYLSTLISFDHIVNQLLSSHDLKGHCTIHQQAPEPIDFPWQKAEGIHIQFNQTYNQILIPAKWMKLAITPIDSELARIAKAHCEQKLEELSPQNLIEQIRYQLKHTDKNDISLKAMAEMLFVSPSTLQRRLRELNTTFKDIKLASRMNEAKQLLTQNQISIEKISEQLGFYDASSFTKSFKSYYGDTPAAYRQNISKQLK